MPAFRRCGYFLCALSVGGITGKLGIEAITTPTFGVVQTQAPTGLLLAVKNAPSGEVALTEWSDYLGVASPKLPLLWVICLENTKTQEVAQGLPNILSFVVEEGMSGKKVIRNFRIQVRTKVVGSTTKEH